MSHAPTFRLLVVDDEAVLSRVTARRLRNRGYETLTAGSGAETLALLAEESFDLVLLDLMMPGMGGLEVLEAIRNERPPDELPVLILTARTDQEILDRALDAGANGLVIKPPAFPDLVRAVRRQLRQEPA